MSSPSKEAIGLSVEAILASPGFANSERMARFLRFVVEKSLAGQPGAVKEYTLGIEVFDRPESFDPKTDTIVRVEARRLRKKLQEYYSGLGAADAIRIDIPIPGYTAVFIESQGVDRGEAAGEMVFKRPTAILGGGLAAIVAAAGLWIIFSRAPNLTSVAVLPFANMSGDAAQEYFADGFTEEVIDRLTSIPGLRVAARTSSFEFKNKPQDVREIGRRMGVDAVVEGSVRRSGNTVRITAQLIRSSDGYHIWSKSWDRQGQDILAMETDVASAVADSFRQTLKPGKPVGASLEAHDLYVLGRHHWYVMEPEEMFKSIEYFERAIAIAPDYALAYSGLSEAYSYLIDLDLMPTKDLAGKAKAAAQKALSLDDSLAEAHTSLGLALMDGDWDFPAAGREFQRAMELKPRYAYGVHWLGHYYENTGRLHDGCAEIERAASMDPLSRMYQLDIVMCRYKERRFPEALAQLRKTRELDPRYPLVDAAEAMVELSLKHWPQTLALVEKARSTIGPIPLVVTTIAQAESGRGNTRKAKEQVEFLIQAAKKDYIPAFAFALASYAAGDPSNGYRSMRRAFLDHNGALVWLSGSPYFDQARGDPRAAELLKHVGDRNYTPPE